VEPRTAEALCVEPFPLPGLLRRIRRAGDWSQRELADRIGSSKTAVAAAEGGTRDFPVSLLARAASAIGGRLAVLDAQGDVLIPMDPGAVRDAVGRRFPAHLDTRYGDVDWWHGDERYSRERPWYTFDRSRYLRDHWRDRSGTPDDHQLPQPGDSPAGRRAQRRADAERRREEEVRRRRATGELPEPLAEWTCECPPECAELDTGERPRHAPGCPCGCDVG
jgi:transcriptional regulator with XRE-family HTH domain